ncbi:MAG: sucrase ferredoxin [Bowdeniella nasicola]|nr:sucrase ferredoxin [Bowdeniella nasicola]
MGAPRQFCRLAAAAEAELAAGTAARAFSWVLLEQRGSWGRRAATQSDLEPELGAELDALCSAAGGRFGLIRPPTQRAHRTPSTHQVVIAGNLVATPWMVRGEIADPRQLRVLNATMLTSSSPQPVLDALPTLRRARRPIALVCTNGKRDVCCALAGRPVAADVFARAPTQVFETSHTGGHRFAPTGVLLPSGLTFARLSGDELLAALDAADRNELHPVLCDAKTNRGLSALAPWEQAAVVAIQCQYRAPVPLSGWQVRSTPAGNHLYRVSVAVADFQRRVMVREITRSAATRPISCGTKPTAVVSWQCTGDYSPPTTA